MEKGLIPKLRQRKYKMSLDHLLALANKEMLKEYGSIKKGNRNQLEEALTGQTWDNLSIKVNIDTNVLLML